MADEFQILAFPDNIRTRPGMYIGSTENCSILLKELIDNAIDEFQKNKNDTIYIEVPEQIVNEDGSISYSSSTFLVADKSQSGFKLDEAIVSTGESTGKTIMDAAISYMHSGSKFAKTTSQSGMNGIGIKAVNALSDNFLMITRVFDKKTKFPPHLKYAGERYYYLKYSKGRKVEEGFTNNLASLDVGYLDGYTTIVKFTPDLSIILSVEYSIPKGLNYITKLASMTNRRLDIFINGRKFESNLVDYKYKFDVVIPGLKNSKNPSIRILGSFELSNDLFESSDIGSVNGIEVNSGKHIDLFRSNYKAAFKELFGDCKGHEGYGCKSMVMLLANEVDFDSQSKKYLSRIPEFDYSNSYKLKDSIKKIMEENRDEFEENYNKIINFLDKKGELNKKQTINHLLGMNINDNSIRAARRADSYKPEGLKDCWSSNRKECELFVFEGKSAASDCYRYRNSKTQAIFSLRGVPLNTSRFSIEYILKNNVEMRNLVKSIGAGVDANSNKSKIRYGKIIIAPDEDEDGERILALVVGFFAVHARFIIDEGKLYVLKSPFYIQDNKIIYSEDASKLLNRKKPFKRIKGLGGLGKYFNDSVTNPTTRRLIQVTGENCTEAIRILQDGEKKKELLIKTGAINTELYVGEKNA